MVSKKKIAKTRKFDGKVYRRHDGVYMEKRQAQRSAARLRRSRMQYRARVVPVRVKGRTATWTGWLVYKRRR